MDPIASSQENEVQAPPLNNPQVEHLAAQPELNPLESTEYEDDEFWPLSGKPYFNVVLAKSHVKRGFTLVITTIPEMSSDFQLHVLGFGWLIVLLRCTQINDCALL